jgi:hypothetical protein
MFSQLLDWVALSGFSEKRKIFVERNEGEEDQSRIFWEKVLE